MYKILDTKTGLYAGSEGRWTKKGKVFGNIGHVKNRLNSEVHYDYHIDIEERKTYLYKNKFGSNISNLRHFINGHNGYLTIEELEFLQHIERTDQVLSELLPLRNNNERLRQYYSKRYKVYHLVVVEEEIVL